MVSCELKGLEGFATHYEPFLQGHYFYSEDRKLTRWYTRDWIDYANVKDNPTDVQQLQDALEAAVKRQLMSDVPYVVLLSGGLDSSITAYFQRQGCVQAPLLASLPVKKLLSRHLPE